MRILKQMRVWHTGLLTSLRVENIIAETKIEGVITVKKTDAASGNFFTEEHVS